MRSTLLALCALLTVAFIYEGLGSFGIVTKPFFGYWDAGVVASGQPFVAQIVQSTANGASARSGLRDGDTIDLRDVSSSARMMLLFQPDLRAPLNLPVHRNGALLHVRFTGSSVYGGDSVTKISNEIVFDSSLMFSLICAWLLALRRSGSREARLLCLTLLSMTAAALLSPTTIVFTNGVVSSVFFLVSALGYVAVGLLPVFLARAFSRPSVWRTAFEAAAVLVAFVMFYDSCMAAAGVITARIDPMPFLWDPFWRWIQTAFFLIPIVVAAHAIATAGRDARPRAAWLLLPIPAGMLVSSIFANLQGNAPSWQVYMALSILANLAVLFAAAAVTYALMRRRLLDFQFVVARTLVVGVVSLIVVAAFVLLEWLLGTALTNVSHATGLAANAALALVLGLSMQLIHRRVDAFVEFLFFHKRHENEKALREFAREAAFVTSEDDLLDLAIETVRARTDAGSVAILRERGSRFVCVRSFGDGDAAADPGENDPAILALKATHRPVDLHRYRSILSGDIAWPMSSRGQMLGILVCGARIGGEAYTPDEIDALSELAAGVGAALESIQHEALRIHRDDAILLELRRLADALTQR